MSNIKHLADLVKICSVLPVFVAVPALASETMQITAGNTYRIVDDVISGADVEGAMYSAAGAPEYVKDTDLAQMYITGSKFSQPYIYIYIWDSRFLQNVWSIKFSMQILDNFSFFGAGVQEEVST